MTRPQHWVLPTDASHRVTTLELLFDLVFVFAFTQVTALMAAEPTPVGAVRGLVVLALLWWAWRSYAWLGNQAHADEGLVRATFIVAMMAMFIVALSIPESFDDLPGGLFAPFVLAACYAVVRLMHLACYVVAAGDDEGLRRQLWVTAIPVSAAAALLVAGGAVGPPYQTVLWALALLIDYVGVWVAGTAGWRLPSPGHFAERHGLIVIVALGESLVAIGVGVAAQPVATPVVLASILGVVVAVNLWWLYFDVDAHVAERTLSNAEGGARTRLARDSYTYLHFPIVISILFVALGLKKVLEYVSDASHHTLAEPLGRRPARGALRRRRGPPARTRRLSPAQHRHLEPASHRRRPGVAVAPVGRVASARSRVLGDPRRSAVAAGRLRAAAVPPGPRPGTPSLGATRLTVPTDWPSPRG
ncbi:MAG: low temperature requirement protein A [Dermatophilaceae bacterium]